MTIDALSAIGAFAPAVPQPAKAGGEDFSARLEAAIASVESTQAVADDKLQAVAAGEDVDLHGAMIALQEADITLRAMVSVRDKAVDAYQTIMNMSI